MKNLSLTFCLVVVALASPVWSETLNDFVERNGKYYLKYSDEGFSGKVVEKIQGTLKNGLWEYYRENGQLSDIVSFKDGKQEGLWEWYYENGQLGGKGNYKNDKPDGFWKHFNEDGTLDRTETFKNGVKVD